MKGNRKNIKKETKKNEYHLTKYLQQIEKYTKLKKEKKKKKKDKKTKY